MSAVGAMHWFASTMNILLLLALAACSASSVFDERAAERLLLEKYPYRWTIDTSIGPPWVYEDMPRGVGYRPGEFPLRELKPPPAILRHFPNGCFFETKVRTNEWHLNEIPWSALVGHVGYDWKEPAVFLSLHATHQSEFFTLFTGTWLASKEERVEFAEALARLVFWYHAPACDYLPTEVGLDEVVVTCSSGKAQYRLRAFFDHVERDHASAFFSSYYPVRPQPLKSVPTLHCGRVRGREGSEAPVKSLAS